jgi:hypothetical protein
MSVFLHFRRRKLNEESRKKKLHTMLIFIRYISLGKKITGDGKKKKRKRDGRKSAEKKH